MSNSAGTGTGATSFDDATLAPPGAPAPPRPARRAKVLGSILAAATGALLIAAVVVTAVIVTHRPHHTKAAHPLRGTIFTLRPGQCLDFGHNGTAMVHLTPCAQPHDAEIYGDISVAGRSWPGTAALASHARAGCQSTLSGYLNSQLATGGLTEFYVYPNQGAWSVGARSVICEIRGTHGQLTGSVRGLGP